LARQLRENDQQLAAMSSEAINVSLAGLAEAGRVLWNQPNKFARRPGIEVTKP